MGFEGYRLILLQINQKLALQHEEELVLFLVLVPVEFSLHDAEANHAVVHLSKGLVVPLLFAGSNEARYINQL
jgi:hypothetical protein